MDDVIVRLCETFAFVFLHLMNCSGIELFENLQFNFHSYFQIDFIHCYRYYYYLSYESLC